MSALAKTLQTWRKHLAQGIWPDDLPKPALSIRPFDGRATSPVSAIAGARQVVETLLKDKKLEVDVKRFEG